MNMLFSITELSNITGKTRPTIYKYINSYEAGRYDDIPFSFIQLLNLMNSNNASRKDILDYCNVNFKNDDMDSEVRDIVTLLTSNKDKLDLDKIKKIIEEEINK